MTDTRDKVLQQALEALEDIVGKGAFKIGSQWLYDNGEEETQDVTDNELAYEAIAAIKEELAKPAPEPIGMAGTMPGTDGFMSSHYLTEGDTQHAPEENLDATIDEAMRVASERDKPAR